MNEQTKRLYNLFHVVASSLVHQKNEAKDFVVPLSSLEEVTLEFVVCNLRWRPCHLGTTQHLNEDVSRPGWLMDMSVSNCLDGELMKEDPDHCGWHRFIHFIGWAPGGVTVEKPSLELGSNQASICALILALILTVF